MPPWVWILIVIVVVTVLNIVGIVSVARANFLLLALQVVFIVVFLVMAVATLLSRAAARVDLMAPLTGDGTAEGWSPGLRGRGDPVPVVPRLRRGVHAVRRGQGPPLAGCRNAIMIATVAAGLFFVGLSYVSASWCSRRTSSPMSMSGSLD